MDFSYPTKPLTDFAKLSSGGTPSKAKPEYWDGDLPWITPKDMGDWNGQTTDKVTIAAVGNGTRIAPAFSSFIAVRGMSLHNEIRIVRASFPATFNQDIKAVQAFEGINGRFLYYCLVAHKPTLLNKVESAGHGTGRLPTDQLESLPIPDVDNETSRAIAKILGDLDDKIDLLREMNRTLEEIARAVFRSWFVDFEPVRAKAAGATSFRGMPQALFDQLPNSFTPSDLGDIPTGWTVEPLSNLLELSYGKSLPAKHRTPGPVAVYGSGGLTGTHNEKLVDGPAIIIGRKGTIGSVYWSDSDIFPIDTVFYVQSKGFDLIFLYQLLSTLPLSNMNTDAAVPGLNRNNANRLKVTKPNTEAAKYYSDSLMPIWMRRARNLEETSTLVALRDTLLPQLISGELPAPDLEAFGLRPTEPVEASDGG